MSQGNKTIKCDQCSKRSILADTFFYNDKSYCMKCLYSLLMDMAESGNVNLDFENCEISGIEVSF